MVFLCNKSTLSSWRSDIYESGGLMRCGLLGWRKSYYIYTVIYACISYAILVMYILLISWKVPDIGSLLADIMVIPNYSILLGKLWNLNITPLQRKINNILQTCMFDFHGSFRGSLHLQLLHHYTEAPIEHGTCHGNGRSLSFTSQLLSSIHHHISQW